jgi:UDPglucose 6-dehydrogenase
VQAYDPQATQHIKKILPEVVACDNLYEAAQGSDAVLILTEWDEFRTANWRRLSTIVARALVFDGRNALAAEEVTSAGFQYVAIGRAPVHPVLRQTAASRRDGRIIDARIGAIATSHLAETR